MNMNDLYNYARQSSANNCYATQASYPGNVRQPQYASSGYDWSDQTHQNYSNSSGQRATYNNGAWDSGRTQVASHDDQTQKGNYPAQDTAVGGGGRGHNSYNSTSSTMAAQNNSGLNNLASGLEDAALQRRGHHQQRSTAVSTLSQPLTAVNRVQSPVATQSASRYDTAQSSNYGNQNDLSSQNPHNSLIGSATALAGNVGARFQQASTAVRGKLSSSPVMNQFASTRQPASQGSASPYVQPQVTKTQTQERPSSITSQKNYGSINPAVSSNQQKAQQIANTGQHRRAPSHDAAQRNSQLQVQPVNSISNLVIHSAEEPAQTQYSEALEPQSIPNYIDPTQVFNPFHKEHERRRKEAAAQVEAELKRKAAEEVAAKKQAEEEMASAAASATDREKGAAAAATAWAMTKEANEEKKQIRRAARTRQDLPSGSDPQSGKQPEPVDSEADMAAGLTAMMEKMQEFRSRDPSLFQKLWDDIQKTSSTPSIPTLLSSTSRQVRTEQALPTTQNHPPPSTTPVPLQTTPPQQPPPQQSKRTPTVLTPRGEPETLSIAPPGAGLNGYRVVVENNPERLPDLGRFPAERRIRTSYHARTSSQKDAIGQSTANPSPVEPGVSSGQATVPLAPERKTATPIAQGLPPRKPTGETMWPEDKRNALAEVAVKFLKAFPENAEIEISPKDIHGILEQNPSYIDLCLMLEKKGLKFHRGQFARQLLNHVPQLRGPAKTPLPPASAVLSPSQVPVPAPVPEGSVATSQPEVTRPASLPIASSAPENGINSGKAFQAAKPPIYKTESRLLAPRYLPMQRSKPARNHYQARPEPVPGSKEAMARKSDFSELIDLTALSDNEDYVMAKKHARAESQSPEPTNLFQGYPNQPLPAYPPPPPVPYAAPGYLWPLRFDPNYPQYAPRYIPLPHYPPAAFPRTPPPTVPQPLPQRSVKILAKPVNKEEALRKTYYDAKTIARDILITAGRHPSERPLNAHLAGLLGSYVDIDSDLSTFDWDAVDPGGPPIPQVPYADVPTEPPRYRLGETGIRRPKGQGPPPPSDANTTQKRLPDSEKRGILPPAPASSRVPASAPPPGQKDKSKPHKPQSPTPPVQGSSDSKVSPRSRGPRVLPQSQVAEAKKVRQSSPKPVIPRKRRGSLISSNGSPHLERTRSIRPPSTQVTPPTKSKTMSEGAFFSSGKRRGRPPGAKNVHPTSGARKKTAQELSHIEITIPSPTSPSLPVFKCRWKGCHAHLHNLDTLRNHVSKVHQPTPEQLKEEGGYICWWKRCKYLEDDGEGSLRPSQVFENSKEWLAHIAKQHLREVAAKLGDGPTTKIIGKQNRAGPKLFDVSRFLYHPPIQHLSNSLARTLSHTDPQTLLRDKARYLSDEQGRKTTPDVSVKSVQDELDADTMTLLKADHDDVEKQAQKSFMKTHRMEKSSPRAVAEETLKAMAARKAKIGPGIDRGGCVLVNEARRATLIQNPGIQRVVDEDY
ncbi:uncharacterized protein A1O5_01465 [Cladophialophora psammophila CBS 110553]|uniref:C2H2-type domain-containing protein n=1 Tax=Cladophialophora psammophila CBS 110553 TaxID=1182543 RepID=W9XBP3_9EURO|nr:uncharacterized protein A1O5_01465 [Cladophialophora psammophila CBS 110553]EXJ74770.1 hypothetical protein A1O5_01465 [Cladophialophora psammophila CBS 110553]